MSIPEGSADGNGSQLGTGRDRRRDSEDVRSAGGSGTAASPGPVPDEAALIAELPDASAVALRLRAAGHPDTTIAVALGIPVQAVPVTVGIARAKLDALRREG